MCLVGALGDWYLGSCSVGDSLAPTEKTVQSTGVAPPQCARQFSAPTIVEHPSGRSPDGWRVEARRKQGKALDVLKQKFRNLETDQSHAHAIEFHLQAEIGPVQTHKSRSSQASTFRGTLKRESLVGTKFDVPDVSKMVPVST